jgi:hypothetical protein
MLTPLPQPFQGSTLTFLKQAANVNPAQIITVEHFIAHAQHRAIPK